jgi:hypothetical protein
VKPLREWSGRRIGTVAVVWLIGLPTLAAPALFGAVGWLARAERERAVTAAQDSIIPGLRIAYAPPQPGDFVISLANPGVMLMLGLLVLPPLALCLAWMIARGRSTQPT